MGASGSGGICVSMGPPVPSGVVPGPPSSRTPQPATSQQRRSRLITFCDILAPPARRSQLGKAASAWGPKTLARLSLIHLDAEDLLDVLGVGARGRLQELAHEEAAEPGLAGLVLRQL